jgi:hypothetical protein
LTDNEFWIQAVGEYRWWTGDKRNTEEMPLDTREALVIRAQELKRETQAAALRNRTFSLDR